VLGGTRAAQLSGETAGQFVFAQQGDSCSVQLLGLPHTQPRAWRLQRQRGVADFSA
jgi:hypothetical protein